MKTLIEILRYAGLPLWLIVAAMYHVMTGGGWRRTQMGRWLMLLLLTPALFLGLAAVAQTWPGREWLDWVRVPVYLWLALIPLWLARMLWVAQTRRRAGRAAGDADDLHHGDGRLLDDRRQ